MCLFVLVTGAISPLSAAAAAAAAAGRVALSGSGVSGVLLASNLNEEVCNHELNGVWMNVSKHATYIQYIIRYVQVIFSLWGVEGGLGLGP